MAPVKSIKWMASTWDYTLDHGCVHWALQIYTYGLLSVADLGGLGGCSPPFLKSQEVQKNECIDIRTQ